MFGIGAPEFILILVIGLIVFGPGKLPEMARSLGKGIREVKKATNALSQAINVQPDVTVQPQQPAAAQAQAQPTVQAQPTPQPQAQPTTPQQQAATTTAPATPLTPAPAPPTYTAPTQDSVRQQVAAQQAAQKSE